MSTPRHFLKFKIGGLEAEGTGWGVLAAVVVVAIVVGWLIVRGL